MAAVLKFQPAQVSSAAQVLDDCCRSTEEQQRLAYRELYRPVLWPATFEQAMAIKHWRIAICRVAINRNRIALRDVVKPQSSLPRCVPVPPTPGVQAAPQPSNSRPGAYAKPHATLSQWPNKLAADRKRLAANDKDDA